ncbi:GNAT family N-acetyltransferase [Afifella sp. IM 167]|uniref:GNAT family N-acetyltransferase n=1 Tax=Afifella sp. IM 167 TaxID=2033586 RepID=UPI001CCA4B44|nr:GNAT family N-acetyltransferase [Afifella sp. IM 167]MBZ8132782.1 GNAT family N-acetyltransferase [Afifella sp. IM 167]
MGNVPELETPRLFLRPLAVEDAPAIQRSFPRWEIVRHLNAVVPWPYPEDGALAYLRDAALPAMEEGREWLWSLRPKSEPDELIGVIGLRDAAEDQRGFWLAPEWQGRGLMGEAADAVTEYWFEVLERPAMRVFKAIGNEGSRRISERQGMRRVALVERDYVCGRLPTEVWEISREEWRRRRA